MRLNLTASSPSNSNVQVKVIPAIVIMIIIALESLKQGGKSLGRQANLF